MEGNYDYSQYVGDRRSYTLGPNRNNANRRTPRFQSWQRNQNPGVGEENGDNNNLRITIVHLEHNKNEAFENVFSSIDNITCIRRDINEVRDADCIVSSANSGGIMNGGVDGSIAYYYPQVRGNVEKRIDENYHGVQPVGTCELVSTGVSVRNEAPIILAHAPTMMMPGDVKSTANAYWAFRAVLCSVLNYNKRLASLGRGDERIRHIVTTGMCDGSGQMPPSRSAKQMKLAYEHIVLKAPIRHEFPELQNYERDIELLRYEN